MKFISLIIAFIFFLNVNLAKAEETEQFDYQEVFAGETVPYDGFLFTHDGISNVVAKTQTKLRLLETQKDEELKRVKINLNMIIEGKNIELNARETMYESQLRAKQDAINSLAQQEKWRNIKTAGMVIGGITVGIITGYICGILSK